MRIPAVLLIIIYMIACHPEGTDKGGLPSTQADSLSTYLISKVEKFSLSYGKGVPDSNALFFYYVQRFDTSMLVHFCKEQEVIKVIVYQVARPYYHSEDLAGDEEGLQFFEGYSFNIDLIQWRDISKKADSLLMTDTEGKENNDNSDGAYYVLAFNSKARSNVNKLDDILLSGFADYLKTTLLNQRMARRPAWQRIDSLRDKS